MWLKRKMLIDPKECGKECLNAVGCLSRLLMATRVEKLDAEL